MRQTVQPSLLDRLTDNDPGNQNRASAEREMSASQMQVILRRDIAWLLSTIRLDEITSLSAHTQAKSSVINYGIRDLSGVSEQNLHSEEIRRTIMTALRQFEPRLEPRSLQVDVIDHEEGDDKGLALLRISGHWRNNLFREMVLLEAKIDMQTGNVALLGS